MTRINWYGDQVVKDATAIAWKRVLAAGSFLKARIQRNVDIATAAAGPSKPGEYPHKVTGTLQKSVFLRRRQDMIAVDVGTKLVYGIHWEVTNRPYIRRTYAEQLGQIRAILDGKMVRTLEDVKGEAAEMKERHRAQKEAIKERKKAAREARQTLRKEKKAKIEAVRQRELRRGREGKKFWKARTKELEKKARQAEKKGQVKLAARLREAAKKSQVKVSRAERKVSWYKKKQQPEK